LNAAKSWEWIDTMPTVRLFKVDLTRVRWITPEEAKRLLEELPEHLQALMQFSVATGLRASNTLLVCNGHKLI
jgi:integrase